MAITAVGERQTFAYTGGVQSFTVPLSGLYSLEVWGAQGGDHMINYGGTNSGLGGYSHGNVYLTKGTVLYIVCGGAGIMYGYNLKDLDEGVLLGSYSKGGYNGGGNGGVFTGSGGGKGLGGGGATHIAKVSGLLSSLSSQISNILIVAGGGGGRGEHDTMGIGGSGGGLSGENGYYNSNDQLVGKGGTQTQGGTSGNNSGERAGFGYGFSGNGNISYSNAGGGGGWYGGGAGHYYAGAGGGSGYIGGVTNGSMQNGVNSGNGKAIITLIQKKSSFGWVGDKEIVGVKFGDTDVSELKVG